MPTERNWAGNLAYQAQTVHRPTSLEQLQEIVARAERVHVLGSRHSFNAIADSSDLISLEAMPPHVTVDRDAGTISFSAGLTYGALAEVLEERGLALHNLPSLPHVSVAGATCTATHGSGERNGNLATAVAALQVVKSDGEIITAARGDAAFDGLAVGIDAIGAVARITLDVEPAYDVRQRVFEGLAWDALVEHFDEIMASGYSVSVFTRWGQIVDQVWVKSRVTDEPEEMRSELFGARPATVDRHPILGVDPVNCTPQLGSPGQWSDRLPHFRMGFRPSTGAELQSEYLLPRSHTASALQILRDLAPKIRPLLQVCEIRAVASDHLWMSSQYGRETVGFHFTWQPDQPNVEALLADVESALAPLDARPHWAKLFVARADSIAQLYERHADFVHLLERLDPRRAFRNTWLEEHVLGTA